MVFKLIGGSFPGNVMRRPVSVYTNRLSAAPAVAAPDGWKRLGSTTNLSSVRKEPYQSRRATIPLLPALPLRLSPRLMESDTRR